MADGWGGARPNSGGKRPGAGRKPKAEEHEIRAALHKAIAPSAVLAKLAAAIEKGESWAITLYLAYDWGKPKEQIDLRTGKILELAFEHDGAVADIAGTEAGSEGDRPPQGADEEPGHGAPVG